MLKKLDADAVADVDAAPVGEPNADVNVDDHQLRPLQIIVGLTKTARTGANNVLTLPTDTRRMRPKRILWTATPTGAITSPNDRREQYT